MHDPIVEICLLVGVFLLVMLTHQGGEHRGEQGEDKCLHQAHEDFQQVERQHRQPAKVRPGHHHDRFQHVFSRKNISVEPEGERHRSDTDRDNLNDSHANENHDEEDPEKA